MTLCSCRFHLVKLLEKFGKVKQFDFLFHKSGPLEGQPRGYCFVNFHTKEVLFDLLYNIWELITQNTKGSVSFDPVMISKSLRGTQTADADKEPLALWSVIWGSPKGVVEGEMCVYRSHSRPSWELGKLVIHHQPLLFPIITPCFQQQPETRK